MTTLVSAPPCPEWCDGICRQSTVSEEFLLHAQQEIEVPATVDDEPTNLLLALVRQDDPDRTGPTLVGIALSTGFVAAGCGFDEEIRLSLDNARRLGALLTDLADRGAR